MGYFANCTTKTVYVDDSGGYFTKEDACDPANCITYSPDDLQTDGVCPTNSVENFEIFTHNTPLNVLKVVIILIILALVGFGIYKAVHH